MGYMTEERRLIQETARAFAMKEVLPVANKLDPEKGDIPPELIQKLADMGYFGIVIPEQYGGLGLGVFEYCLITEELARAWMSVASIIARGNGLSAGRGMTDAQRAVFLPRAARGEFLGAAAISEPNVGSDLGSIACRARRDGDSWVINGTKMFITNGVRANFLTLVAQTDPGSGHRGVSLFIVDTASPGVSVSRKLDKLGMLSSDTAEISLEDVVVPNANLIGDEPGQGFAQLMWQLQYERLSGAAGSIGAAQEILDQTITYARERRAFGRPIADHQVIAHKLADAATELEAARALFCSVVWRIQEGEYPVAEISMAKKYAAQVSNRLIDTCVQVHGGVGYMAEFPVSRAYRDARLWRIGAGTDEIMNEVIAKRLGISG